MRAVLIGLAVFLALGLAAIWLTGADAVVLRWAMERQRETQDALAAALRALRAGDPGALSAFAGLCFAYGFFHAAGPGHGKLLIGGYGAARQVGLGRLSAVALLSSLAQSATAIALVAAGLWLLGWGRERMTGLAEDLFAPLSFAAIAAVGLWLACRGARGLWARPARGHGHAHGPSHHDHNNQDPHHHLPHDHPHAPDADGTCATCGHAHGPDPQALARATGWREMAVLIGAVAIRPCTGALFVLIVTAQLGIFASGILGTLAMGLGTASVTVAVAIAAVTLRQGALAGLAGGGAIARAQPVIELAVGLGVAALAGSLALAAL